MKLNLEAKNSNQKLVLEYLEANASDVLAEKINTGKKTLAQCWSYITAEAKKQAVGGCACIDDSTVFGWAIHFFEEESIEAKMYSSSGVSVNPQPVTADKNKRKKSAHKDKPQPAKSKKNEPSLLEQNQFSFF